MVAGLCHFVSSFSNPLSPGVMAKLKDGITKL